MLKEMKSFSGCLTFVSWRQRTIHSVHFSTLFSNLKVDMFSLSSETIYTNAVLSAFMCRSWLPGC